MNHAPVAGGRRALQTGPGTAQTAALLSQDQAWRLHAAIMMGVTAMVIVLSLAPGTLTWLSPAVQALLLAVCVALLGVPHGALDHLVVRPHLRPVLKKAWLPVFLVCYLAAAGLVLWGWGAGGTTTLLLFLAASAYHFGDGDVVRTRYKAPWETALLIGWRGLLVIGLPVVCHPEETTRIFAALLPSVSPDRLLPVISTARGGIMMGLAALGFAVLFAALRPAPPSLRRLRRWDAFESLVIAALFWAAPPLVAFLVYFCGWHSLRHTLHLAADLGQGNVYAGARAFAVHSLPLTLATFILAAIAYPFLARTTGEPQAGILRLVFYGLSALTAPHMIIVAYDENARQKSLRKSVT